MAETQRIKIKRELLLLLDFHQLFFLLIPPKLLRLTYLSPFFMMMYPLTKSFPLKMTCLHHHFFLEYSFFLSYPSLDAAL